MALGADPRSVYQLIVGEAARLVGAGTVLGMGGSIAAATLLRGLFYGVRAWDVPTLTIVVAVLILAALLASYIPATVEQKSDAANYRRGMVVTFNARAGSIRRGQTLEVERVEGGRLWLDGHNRPVDVARHAEKLTVSLSRTTELCPGEKILVRRNHRDAGLVNGQVLTVTKLCADGSLARDP